VHMLSILGQRGDLTMTVGPIPDEYARDVPAKRTRKVTMII